MIELITAGHLRYFLKAQVIIIRLMKGKYHMYKIPAQLRNPGNALMLVRNTDHGFGWSYGDRPYFPELGYEMMI